jgi:hypothetical protein
MKTAVIGAGIFGITTALKLSNDHSVDLYEKQSDILGAASGINQYRLHRGYHYPRSKETVQSVLKSEKSFKEEFGESIIDNIEHYYCISKRDSLTSAKQYLKFCDDNNLEYNITDIDIVKKDSVDLSVKVNESLFDPLILKNICWNKLRQSNINLQLNKEPSNQILSSYDVVILCTYSNLNDLLKQFPDAQLDYQFELCEKPVAQLSDVFENKSIVIMDGPFMSVDPMGRSGFFVLGNVVHAIHKTNIGKYPQIDEKFLSVLNKGIISDPQITNFDLFVKSATEFMPDMKQAKHIGSMYTIRAVLPYVENSDARPTVVRKINEKMLTVFSGKITTCVEAANEVYSFIESKIH